MRSRPGGSFSQSGRLNSRSSRPPHDRVRTDAAGRAPGCPPTAPRCRRAICFVSLALRKPHGAPVVVARLDLRRAGIASRGDCLPQRAGVGRADPQHRRETHPRDIGQPAECALPGHRAEAFAVQHQLGSLVGRQLAATGRGSRRSSAGRRPSTSPGRRETKSSSAERNTAIRRCAVSPLYIISSDRAATGLIQPVPVVGTITSSLRSKAPVRSSSLSSTAIRLSSSCRGVEADVHADRFLGGPAVQARQLVGVRAGGDEVAALEAQRLPRRVRRWTAGPFGLSRLHDAGPGGGVLRLEHAVRARQEATDQHAVDQRDGQHHHDRGADEQRHLVVQMPAPDEEPRHAS